MLVLYYLHLSVLFSIAMKQLLQNISDGNAIVVEVPAPGVGRGEILVRVGASLVSAGTERMVVDFAEKNIVQKAFARPDLVRQVLNKASREGILSTFQAVRQRLDSDMALGYSNAGEVLEVVPRSSLKRQHSPLSVQLGCKDCGWLICNWESRWLSSDWG
jgi:hypothetical protein